MRRYAGQKALYEAMSRSRSKGKRPSMLARLRPQLEKLRPQLEKLRQLGASRVKKSAPSGSAAKEKPAPMTLKPPKPVEIPRAEPQAPAQRWLRPKAVQVNDGRIEVSVRYQIGIIIGLGLVLILLMGFWIGRLVGRMDERAQYKEQTVATEAGVGQVAAGDVTPPPHADTPAPATTEAERAEPQAGETAKPNPAPERTPERAPARQPAAPTGTNVIVIARHADVEQLRPVQAYFAEHGIDTTTVSYERLREVFAERGLDPSRLPQGDGYMLVTNQFCDNPGREGTDGYAIRQRIVELGRGYQAPSGYESFARNQFSDAYGMKIAR